jgi:CBS domain-containing protein
VLTGDFVGGMWWFLIGLFVRFAAQASYQQVVMREALRGVPVRRIMTADPITVPPGITIADLIDDYVYRHRHNMFPVVDGGRLVGCVSLNEIKRVARDRWPSTTVAEVMRPCSGATAISPDMDAMAVLAHVTRTRNSRLLVTEGDRLVGLITLRDVMNFLNAKLNLEVGEALDHRHPDVTMGEGDRRQQA